MKKRLVHLITIAILFFAAVIQLMAQGFSYQAVVRDANGNPIEQQAVVIRFTLQNTDGETVYYTETHSATTSPQGIFSLTVGGGENPEGDFSQIPWGSNEIEMKVEVDIAGNSQFVEMGVSRLNAVPVSLFALDGNPGPQGEPGVQGEKGDQGNPGADGRTLLNGTANPTAAAGVVGDFYLNTSTSTLYGPKTASGWPASGVLLIGPKGDTGNPGADGISIQWLGTLTTEPSGATLNQAYYNSADGKSYVYTGTTWSQMAQDGQDGQDGTANLPAGSAGQSLVYSGGTWTASSNIFTSTASNVGIGNAIPSVKLDVTGDIRASGKLVGSNLVVGQQVTDPDEPLFVVRNSLDKIVFAVYESGVRMYVDSDGAKASKGGFAIGGLTPAKESGSIYEYFRVTPDSVRISIDEATTPSGGKTSKGGFAVGGLTPAKKGTAPEEYLRVTRDSSRIYVNTESGVKSGTKGGFAVGGLTPAKQNGGSFMFLTLDNYFIGHESGVNTVPGTGSAGRFNTFFGYQTGIDNITGHSNVFIGNKSGFNNEGHPTDQNLGSRNVFLGFEAGYSNTLGSDNIMLGYQSGYNNTTAGNNVCLGTGAGFSNKANSDNVFIGLGAGYFHGSDGPDAGNYKNNIYIGIEAGKGVAGTTMGKNNVYIGPYSGKGSTTAQLNVFMGFKAGEVIVSGSENVFIGNETGKSTQGGGSNTFLGTFSGKNNIDGANNTFVGDNAGLSIQSGYRNTFVGSQAGQNSLAGSYNVFMGFNAGRSHNTGDNNVYIGYQAGVGHHTNLEKGANNVYIGTESGSVNTTGNRNVFIGYQSGFNNTTGSRNTYFGNKAGYSNTAGGTGKSNVFIGDSTGYRNSNGSDNVFIGSQVGVTNTSGNKNVYIGYMAGFSNNSYSNVLIGWEAGANMGAGYDNVYIGYKTGSAGHGQYNVFLGCEAGAANTGGLNTYVGAYAGRIQSAGGYNTYVGLGTGWNKTSGENNTIIGTYAGAENIKGSNNVFIGYNAGYSETASNTLHIANSSTPLIFGFFETDNNNQDTLRSVVIDGRNSYGYKFYVTGRAGGHFDWNSLSDGTFKRNIQPIESALTKTLKLKGVNFEWIDDKEFEKGMQLGFIAQEVEKVVPEVVHNFHGRYSMQYGPLTALLVEAIKEQQLIIDKQQEEINALKGTKEEIDKLKAELESIKAMITK